jgi:hypothetical protein
MFNKKVKGKSEVLRPGKICASFRLKTQSGKKKSEGAI